ILVTEIWNGRDGDADDKGQRRYSRIFQVRTNDARDGSLVVRLGIDPVTLLAVPQPFSTYVDLNGNFDLGAWCTHVRPRQDPEDPFTWEVRCEYDSLAADQQFSDQNPLNRPPRISWGFTQFQIVAEQDANGKVYVNSAGERFDPPPMIDDTRLVCTIERN